MYEIFLSITRILDYSNPENEACELKNVFLKYSCAYMIFFVKNHVRIIIHIDIILIFYLL